MEEDDGNDNHREDRDEANVRAALLDLTVPLCLSHKRVSALQERNFCATWLSDQV